MRHLLKIRVSGLVSSDMFMEAAGVAGFDILGARIVSDDTVMVAVYGPADLNLSAFMIELPQVAEVQSYAGGR